MYSDNVKYRSSPGSREWQTNTLLLISEYTNHLIPKVLNLEEMT